MHTQVLSMTLKQPLEKRVLSETGIWHSEDQKKSFAGKFHKSSATHRIHLYCQRLGNVCQPCAPIKSKSVGFVFFLKEPISQKHCCDSWPCPRQSTARLRSSWHCVSVPVQSSQKHLQSSRCQEQLWNILEQPKLVGGQFLQEALLIKPYRQNSGRCCG